MWVDWLLNLSSITFIWDKKGIFIHVYLFFWVKQLLLIYKKKINRKLVCTCMKNLKDAMNCFHVSLDFKRCINSIWLGFEVWMGRRRPRILRRQPTIIFRRASHPYYTRRMQMARHECTRKFIHLRLFETKLGLKTREKLVQTSPCLACACCWLGASIRFGTLSVWKTNGWYWWVF